MTRSKHFGALVPIMIITIACFARCGNAVLMTGLVSNVEAGTYKITIESDEMLTINVNEYNLSEGCIIGVVLALGMAQNLGDTLYVAAAVINSTQNATLTYTHVDQTPLYLIIIVIEGENVTVQYKINSTHPIIEYPYSQYYQDVVLPELVPRVAFLGVALGFVALVITAYMLKRRRAEQTLTRK